MSDGSSGGRINTEVEGDRPDRGERKRQERKWPKWGIRPVVIERKSEEEKLRGKRSA
jgi:hypothetical protein